MDTREQSAADFLAGRTVKPKIKSLTRERVMIGRNDHAALCSYGPHFPVLVRLGLGRVAYNPSDYDGDAYREMTIERRERLAAPLAYAFGYDPEKRVPKYSPTTRAHVRAAHSALIRAGYVRTLDQITIGDYALEVWRR